MSKYTSVESISRKLIGRLNLQGEDGLALQFPDNPTQLVDPLLVEEVIEESESLLDRVLEQIYELPLQNKHPILKTIIDGLVVSDMILIHFSGVQWGTGADLSGYGLSHQTKSYQLINALTAGMNIVLPMQVPVTPTYPGMIPQRRLELPGEVLVTRTPAKILVNNQTIVKRLDNGDRSDYITEQDLSNNPFSDEYRYNRDYEN
jgi:hypothetical protein